MIHPKKVLTSVIIPVVPGKIANRGGHGGAGEQTWWLECIVRRWFYAETLDKDVDGDVDLNDLTKMFKWSLLPLEK